MKANPSNNLEIKRKRRASVDYLHGRCVAARQFRVGGSNDKDSPADNDFVENSSDLASNIHVQAHHKSKKANTVT
jgi:hypothetical protein